MPRSLVSLVRNLQRRNPRRRSTTAVLESIRLCEEALDAGVKFTGVLVSPGLGRTKRGAALFGKLEEGSIRIEEVEDRTLRELADTDAPQGVLAVVEPREWHLDDLPEGRARIVVLDGVQDPGNVGTICRTTFGLGGHGVVLLPGTAHVTNPKVLRAAMGSTFRIPVVSCEYADLMNWLRMSETTLWVADAAGADIRGSDVPARLALAIGNEGAGVTAPLVNSAERTVSIPLVSRADSLNAATAAAILLYEVAR